MQDQPSRLDRIEALIESSLENQAEVNAAIRANQVIHEQEIAQMRELIDREIEANTRLRQNLELQAQNLSSLVDRHAETEIRIAVLETALTRLATVTTTLIDEVQQQSDD